MSHLLAHSLLCPTANLQEGRRTEPCAETQLTAPLTFAPGLDALIGPLHAFSQMAASCLITACFSWDPPSPLAGWHGASRALPRPSSVPLEDLQPQDPILAQLVHRWQWLWMAAQDRQHRLQSAQRRLQEVRMAKCSGRSAPLEWPGRCREGPELSGKAWVPWQP